LVTAYACILGVLFLQILEVIFMLTHIGTQVIETERLILRPFKYSDDDAMLKYWIADEKIQSLYSEPVYSTKEEVKGLLDKYIGSYQKEDYYRWAIIDKANNECICQIAYFLVDSKNHFAEIEYCIGSDFQCRGYATEATKAVIDYGFNRINLHKVQICTKTINKPSKRVIEKCGFTYEGTLRDYFYMNNQYVGRLYFSILREEYENKAKA
jgi:ribosomal-protein-alanine N-acetyltransferase